VTEAAALASDLTPTGPQSGPIRRCLVTGEERPKVELVRFVVGPEGAIVPDIDGRLPGRGLWTLARRDIVERGVTRHLFARAAKRPVVVDTDLADRVERLLTRRCIDGVGLARRAGQAVPGFEKTRILVEKGRCALLVVAADAAGDGRRKVTSGAGLPVADALRSEELGIAFGRDDVTYAGVAVGALAERVAIDSARLAGFRSQRANGATTESILDEQKIKETTSDR
jgi:predicted RNA-binding protein YlxR (DUF448 family)